MHLMSEENHKFFKHMRKIYKYLSQMDRTKYLEPKFSESLEPLSKFIKDKCDSETMSTMTSQFSMFKNSAAGGT